MWPKRSLLTLIGDHRGPKRIYVAVTPTALVLLLLLLSAIVVVELSIRVLFLYLADRNSIVSHSASRKRTVADGGGRISNAATEAAPSHLRSNRSDRSEANTTA